MKKQAKKRMLAFLLSVCLCLGMLPADLLGGIAQVQAATNEHNVEKTTGEWDASGKRTTTWDFSNATDNGKQTGDYLGLSLSGDKVSVKTKYVSMINTGAIELPIASEATKVDVIILPQSLTTKRSLKIGNDTKNDNLVCGTDISSNTEWKKTYTKEDGYFTSTSGIKLMAGDSVTSSGKTSNEIKLSKITLVEYKATGGSTSDNDPGSVSGDDPGAGDNTVTYTDTYNFCDGSIIPSDTDGKKTVTSANKRLTVAPGNQNAYAYNGTHGVQFKTGNTITISVYGDTTIEVGKCTYSKGTVSLSKDGEEIAAGQSLAGGCAKDDATLVAKFDYTGTACDLVLNFTDSSYVPFVKVSGKMPKEDIEMIPYTDTYNFTDGSIIPSDTDGKKTVTSANKRLTVAPGNQNAYAYNGTHGVQFKTGNTITISVYGDTTIEVGKCTYSKGTVSLSKDGEEIAVGQSLAGGCAKDDATLVAKFDYTGTACDLVLNFTDSSYVPFIKVSGKMPKPTVTEVTATVTINDAKALLKAGDTIKLVNSDNKEDAIDITTASATPITLKVNATYNVVSSNPDIEATVNKQGVVVTTTENLNVTVDLASTVVTPVVTIVDQDNVLDGAKITLTNSADDKDVQELKNNEKVKLKIGDTYKLACESATVVVTIEKTKILAVKDNLEKIQVDVVAADTTHHTIDVWDFGAEQLENDEYNTYNNKLTVDIINSWFDNTPGISGVEFGPNLVANDAAGNPEFIFNTNGKTNNRLRTINEKLTRKDEKSLKDIEDETIVYQGYLYSNSSKTDKVNVQLAVKAGDKVTFVVSNNGTASDITWKAPSGKKEVQTYSGSSSNAQKMTFYAAEDGMYTLYSANEKLVVARIYRERPATVTVSGKVTVPEGANLNGAKLVFTNETTGHQTEATITNGSYSVGLLEQYKYKISLSGANGYIVGMNNTIKLANEAGNTTFPVEIVKVDLVTVTGSLAELTVDDAAKLELTFTNLDETKPYVPEFEVVKGTNNFKAVLEKGQTYKLAEENVGDYILTTTSISASVDGTKDIVFTKKPVYDIAVTLDGPTVEKAEKVKLTFSYLKDLATGEIDSRYVYEFTGISGIKLRDGQYKVKAVLEGYEQAITADLKVAGASVAKTIAMKSTAPASPIPYQEIITVAQDGSGDYGSVNEALEAVRNMTRDDKQRVTISIKPGNYEEMLVVDVDNVTLKNASATPSIALKDRGVNIDENAVRITSYYGHGYSYYSMGDDCKYDADLLAANKLNGYPSFTNPGSGTTNGSYWNATVVVMANGFKADGVIFENSFNQYVSKKAAEDIIVKQSAAKEAKGAPRADMEEGSTEVQQKAYVERAAALAIGNGMSNIVFDNCKFIGRQDTLYGGKNTYVEFNKCSIYGGTDYIFGGMIAIFDKCDLVFNTTDDKNDVGYITAAQQDSGRGYFMNECHITSVVANVDVDAAYYTHNTSKPGYFGRPWAKNSSEVVFYNTTIDAADSFWHSTSGTSLIVADGWNSSLSGESAGMCEYGTVEKSGVDNSANRVSWATVLTSNKLADGTYITKEAFRKKSEEGLYVLNLSKGLKAGVNYDGGLSVLEDMPLKTDGFVQGANNAKDADGNGAKDYAIPVTGAAVKIVAEGNGRFKVNLKSAGGKDMYWVDVDNSDNNQKFVSNANEIKVFALEKGHTYYFYGNGTKPCMYSLALDYRPYVAWNTVSNPSLGTPVAAKIGDADEGVITIPFTAAIGSVYSESMDIKVFRNEELVDTISVKDETDPLKGFEATFKYEPEASGSYTFQAVLKRSDEENKTSSVTEAVSFVLPMAKPVIVNTENTGSGNVRFIWKETPEATSYEVYLNDKKVGTTDKLFYRFEGLTVGTEYNFGIVAIGNDDASEKAVSTLTVTADAQKNWLFAAFGQGVDKTNNKVNDKITGKEDTTLALQSTGGKGKLVPASTDGLAFYYTTIDPETENFTLSAKVKVDEWTYSNGQEGFGMMVADAVGEDGDSSVFWNNSYMASVTKVEYYWDSASQTASDGGTKYTMKLGVGSQEKIGVSKENLSEIEAGNLDDFRSTMTTLETSCPKLGLPAGTYNLAKNYTNKGVDMGDVEGITDTFDLTIQRNNTGYFVSYTDKNGVTTTKKYYHGDDGDELTKLDPNNIYVGFFASRNAKITVTDVELTTIKPEDDAPAEERPLTYVSPNYRFESASIANSKDYEIVFIGNADGTLKLEHAGKVLADGVKITANEKYKVPTTLNYGYNEFVATFTPNADYYPSKYERLSSYETKVIKAGTTYQEFNRNIIYVSPNGSANADGSKDNPMSIYKAVCYVQPGNVILLKEGTYSLNSTLTIERGIDGTAANNIYMIADPEAKTRPVLDFNRACAGMVMAGNYWYFQGFDVTNSANGQKGIQVSGSYNTLDNLWAYKNGNTGIQISRFKGTDHWEDWPSNNLILNCTSFLNADAGYEDADGFAAKLTIADGNVFDGCIAAYNADDGWDLFAKIESGPIGQVKIQNSVAFKNGYVVDENGSEVNAGNGNGFKMGGSSISGHHLLYNSVAFANKAKGIDSNSCPDIMVYRSTSFDNESYNVAFYTNDAKNTDFTANGVLSYKKSYTEGESIKLKGTQDESKVYGVTNYYFNSGKSKNSAGDTVTDQWFVNLETANAIKAGITRNANGTINMNGYLELTSMVPEGVGARIAGMASKKVVLPELVVREDDDDDDNDNTQTVVPPTQPVNETKPATNKKPSKNPEKTQSEQGEAIVKKIVVNKDMDWNEVNEVLRDLVAEAAGGKAVLEVELGKHHEISADVLVALMETEVTIRLQQSNGLIWEINGKDITNPANVNMKVDLTSKPIPADKLEIFKDAESTIQFSLEHNGDFGFKATMRFPTGKNAEGKYANLFYFNNGEFEFMESSKVEKGYADFSFTHASDYVVVISEAAMSAVPEVKAEAAEAETSGKNEAASGNTGNTASDSNVDAAGSSRLPIILIIIAALVVGGIAIGVVVMRKKKEE